MTINDETAYKTLIEQTISLKEITLFRINLPQRSSFSSGIGTRNSREALIIKWTDLEGNIGYGECACRPDPYYSDEYLDAVIDLIQKFVFPLLQSKQTYAEILQILRRIRGWNFAKGAIESTIFQIARSQAGFNLSDSIHAEPIKQIPVGISIGIYKDKKEFYDVVQQAIEDGFQRLKFKISPTADTAVFDHINPLLFDNQVHTGFDANGSFYDADLEKLGYFVNTYQTVIEQPLPPSRFDIYLEAKKRYPSLKVCADEEVKHIGDLIKLHQLNAIDELNLKVGRVGGISAGIEILNYCHRHDIPCWIGGMFETGIGRLVNLEFASYLPNAKAHDLSPSARYFMEDIISPEVTMDKGFVDLEKMQACKVMPGVIEKYTTKKIVKKVA